MATKKPGGPTRRSVLGGGAVVAALGLSRAASAARNDNIARHAVAADHINSLDPSIVSQNADANASRQIFDALIDPPNGTFDLKPDQVVDHAAENWEVSKDGRSYTIKLREGMLFHKGYGEVTAEDAKFTFDRLGPKGNSSYRSLYEDMDEVAQLDKYHFRITLKRPDPQFYAEAMLSRGAGIVSKKAVEKLGDDFRRQPVGSGPFEFVTIDRDRGVVLKRFEQYYRAPAKLDGLEYRYIGDPSARTLGFIKGELDLIEGARLPGWTDDLKRQAPQAHLELTRPGSTNVVFFNMTRKPFDDVRVRKAIRIALDRNVFAQAFGDLYGDVWGVNPPAFPGALQKADVPAELRYEFAPDRAKELLAEAGFPRGFTFDNVISQREDYSSIMLMIQDMLRVINVNMRLQTIDHTAYHNQCARDAVTLPMNSSTYAPVGTLMLETAFAKSAVVTPTGGSGLGNYSHYGETMTGIDDLLDKLLDEPDLDTRMALTREAELRILRDLPAWNALSLSFVTARSPRIDLGYPISASYPNFSMYPARIVA